MPLERGTALRTGMNCEDMDAAAPPRGTAGAGGWVVMLSEREEHGGWRTTGEPLPDVTFETMALAHDFAEFRNRCQFGHGFDWASDPSKAWIAVREEQQGRLQGNARV